METKIKQGTEVTFHFEDMEGEAKVVGISSKFPTLGNIYILQTDSVISEEYPWTSFICPESHIKIKNR
jgi:hypothetical protein